MTGYGRNHLTRDDSTANPPARITATRASARSTAAIPNEAKIDPLAAGQRARRSKLRAPRWGKLWTSVS